LSKKNYPEFIEIIVTKHPHRNDSDILVIYSNRGKIDKKEANDKAVRILNDFKEKYLAEIDKAKQID